MVKGTAGANLEMAKFALYVFFPIATMAYFSDPEWYERHVAPYRAVVWPDESTLNHPPSNRDGAVAQLAQMKKAREQARLESQSATTNALNQGMDKIRAARDESERPEGKLGMRERRFQMDGLLGGFAPGEKEQGGFWGSSQKTQEKLV